jgi:hypothetical protein
VSDRGGMDTPRRRQGEPDAPDTGGMRMASVFDLVLRRLIQQHPEQLLALIFGATAPRLVRAADTSLPQSERRADALLIVEQKDERFVVEVEVQAQLDPGFSRRLLDYAVRAHLREGLPVLPVALYLLPDAEGGAPPYGFSCAGRRVLAFDFQVVRLWEVDFSRPELQQPALLPLSVLEERALPARVAWAEERLQAAPGLSAEERLDLLVVLGTLATRRFGSGWLSQSLRNIMLDSPFWEEQRAKERRETQVRMLLEFATARGASISPEAQARLLGLESDVLTGLVRQLATAPDAAAIERLLSSAEQHGH